MYICTIVISVSLHMSVITQDGDSVLMMAIREGKTEVISLLLEAGANTDLQNKVHEIIVYSTPAKKVNQERKKDTASAPWTYNLTQQ